MMVVAPVRQHAHLFAYSNTTLIIAMKGVIVGLVIASTCIIRRYGVVLYIIEFSSNYVKRNDVLASGAAASKKK